MYEALVPLLRTVTDLDNIGPPYAPQIRDATLPVLQRVSR
jgi:hypothetical protein